MSGKGTIKDWAEEYKKLKIVYQVSKEGSPERIIRILKEIENHPDMKLVEIEGLAKK